LIVPTEKLQAIGRAILSGNLEIHEATDASRYRCTNGKSYRMRGGFGRPFCARSWPNDNKQKAPDIDG